MAMILDWSFESGSLAMYDVDKNAIRALVRRDYDWRGRNWAGIWCYFCIRGAKGEEIEVRFVDLTDEWNERTSFSWGAKTRPVYSVDHRHWRRFDTVTFNERDRTLTVKFTPESESVWVAYIEPYPLERLDHLVARVEAWPGGGVRSLGKSVLGREIQAVSMGRSKRGKHAWILCRQHPWETGTSYAAEGLIERLMADTPEAENMREQVRYTIVPIANPDGVALGGTRYNALGYDLNRNYDQVSPTLCPETYYVLREIERCIDEGEDVTIFNLHNNNQEAVDYIAGHAETLGQGLLEQFAKALRRHTFFRGDARSRVEPTCSNAGRALPMVLLELRTGFDPTLNRYITWEDQKSYGAGLAAAIYETLTGDDIG